MSGSRGLWTTCAGVALCACSGELPPVPPTGGEASAGADESQGPVSFEEATDCGVHFQHVATRTAEKYMPEVLGCGVAACDFDRDGAPDLFFANGGALSSAERPSTAGDRLYLNDGAGRFADASEAWGLASRTARGYGMGVACGDYDGDGSSDVFLTSFGPGEALLRNSGERFEDVTQSAGLAEDPSWSVSAGFFDPDLDGDLDLFVVRYVDYEVEHALRCTLGGRHVYCSPIMFDPLPDRFLRNAGDGTFSDASDDLALAEHPGKGLALLLADVDLDGDTDAYVANDSSRNLLFLNDGAGGFSERGRLVGVAYNEAGREEAGMGTDLTDVDGNGLPDLACSNFQGETTNLYLQVRPLVFRDRSFALGVGDSARDRLSFGVEFFDADNDGDEDLYVANGHIDDEIDAYSTTITFAQRDTFYLNEAGAFRDVTLEAGPGLQPLRVSRAAVAADLDNDGRLDLVVTESDGPARLLFNRTRDTGNSLSLLLEGGSANRNAIGARVEAQVGGQTLVRQVVGSSSYASTPDFRVHVGLGSEERAEIRVVWPGGDEQVLGELGTGYWRVVQGAAPESYEPGRARF